MQQKPAYTMKFVAMQTGLKPYLIRSWEARYRAIRPHRSANLRRSFSDADIRRLTLLKRAVDQGHAISAVARLTDGDLAELAGRVGGTRDAGGNVHLNGSPAVKRKMPSGRWVVERALAHIKRLDAPSLDKVLNAAAVEMPRQSFVQEVVLPLFGRIGEHWRNGQMKIVSEHMASVVVRAILWEMLRSALPGTAAPLIVVATPVGHWHEVGALASAVAAAESGWRVAYLGANLPSEEMAYAVKRLKAGALAVSLCHLLGDNRLIPEMRKLRRLIGPQFPVFIGGPGAVLLSETNDAIQAVIGIELNDFRAQLEALAQNGHLP